jgi:uncharacterized protein
VERAMTMSDWSKVERPVPVPDALTRPFWDGARQGQLLFQRCQVCGNRQHPPAPTCSDCVSTDLNFEPVGGAGTIFGYTVMYHSGDPRLAPATPYAVVVVELDDAPGVLLAGNLLGVPAEEAHVGRRVEVVFDRLDDEITLPQFRIAE